MRKILIATLALLSGCINFAPAPSHVVVEDMPESRRIAKQANASAIACMKAGELENALVYIKAALESDEKYGPAYNTLGIYYLSKSPQELANAAKSFHTASSLMEDKTVPLYHLGNTWELKGAWEKAIAEYDKVLARKSDHHPSYSCKARARIKLKKYDTYTLEMLKRIQISDPRKDWQNWAKIEAINLKAKLQTQSNEF